jgi:dolichyl-phosphate-mannose-protein mannosyltransferase
VTRQRVVALALPIRDGAVAGLARFVLLGQPDRIVFDETYYVADARSYLDTGVEEGFAVHPPVGKWLVAAGIALAGDSPVGWRAASALAGTLLVLATYLAGRRLLPGIGAAALAGLLAATDGLLVVQSRIAMLDIFLALFVVLGAWFLLVDRDKAGRSPPWRRPALLLAGGCFGLAVATKWAGVLALAAAVLALTAWELAARGRDGRILDRPGSLAVTVAVALVLVPGAVYAAAHVPWLAAYPHTHEARTTDCEVDGQVLDPCPVSLPDRLAGLGRHHAAVWRFHWDLEAEHPYTSHAWTWPLMLRPIVYYWESCPPGRAEQEQGDEAEPCVVAPGNAAEIVALGNAALWWVALAALVPLGAGLWRRDPRAGFVLAFWAGQYVPWLVVGRPLFFFYMTPVVPFMALGVAYAAVWLNRGPIGHCSPRERSGSLLRQPGTVAAIVVAVASVVLLAYFYPILTGMEMDEGAIRSRWWLDGWV